MEYQHLKKIYYKQGEDAWQKEYSSRFNAPFTQHLNFYINQQGFQQQHQAFYCFTNELTLLINNILSDSLKLQSLINRLPFAGIMQFLHSIMVEEIKSNNAIEGIHSSRREIKFAMAQQNPQKYVRLWGIVNKYNKIISSENIPLMSCSDIRNLYNDFLLKEIERSNPQDVPDGKLFRKNSVDVVSPTGKSLHRGVFPEEKIVDSLSYALSVLHSENIPSLIRLSIFHFLFAYIHPFYDGNGRTIRFITSYFLAKEIDPTVALRLSCLIKNNSTAYSNSFSLTENDKNLGDLTPFIISSLSLIHDAVIKTGNTLYSKLEEFRKCSLFLDKLNATDDIAKRVNNVLLQATIFSDIGATIDEILRPLNIKSRKTVQSRLDALPENILLIDKTVRPYRFKLNLSELRNL